MGGGTDKRTEGDAATSREDKLLGEAAPRDGHSADPCPVVASSSPWIQSSSHWGFSITRSDETLTDCLDGELPQPTTCIVTIQSCQHTVSEKLSKQPILVFSRGIIISSPSLPRDFSNPPHYIMYASWHRYSIPDVYTIAHRRRLPPLLLLYLPADSHPRGPSASYLPLLDRTLPSPRWISAWKGSKGTFSPSMLM